MSVVITSGSGATSSTSTLASGDSSASVTAGTLGLITATFLSTNTPCRVRVYLSASARDNDRSRPAGTDPIGPAATDCKLDAQTGSVALAFALQNVILYSGSAGAQTLYFNVERVGSATTTISVSLTLGSS